MRGAFSPDNGSAPGAPVLVVESATGARPRLSTPWSSSVPPRWHCLLLTWATGSGKIASLLNKIVDTVANMVT